jgi:pyruvate/2-oxoglutarate dehydrogenase complex dihydrolipoamide dehydrogenase (E3) component
MIGRANLCDSEFANKAKEGRAEDIRPCIGCLRCLNGIMFGKPVACTMNPSFGLENEDNIPKANEKKKVLVIGSGPAGLEAAYIAKKRGHEVVLCEKDNELGGSLKAASVPIGKQDLCKVIKWMVRRLDGVDIRKNTMITKELLETEFKDYEVIACVGAKPIIIDKFTEFKQWMSADDILTGKAFPGRKIVIIGGGSVGCETADYLAPIVNDRFPRNRDITVIEMDKEIMLKESGPGRSLLVRRMMEKGIHIIVDAKVEKVEKDKIIYVQNNIEHEILDADTLVFASGYKEDRSLEEIFKQLNMTYYMIGDAHKVGNIKDAISEAYEITRHI